MGFSEKISELEKVIVESMPLAKEVALKTMLGLFLDRIFNKGRDSNDNPIGKYNPDFMVRYYQANYPRLNSGAKNALKKFEGKFVYYITLRRIAGRQIEYVDLQFSDEMFLSIIIGDYNGEKVIGFSDSKNADKAKKNENNFKKIIFEPTQEEIEIAQEAYLDCIREQVQETFNSW